MLLKLRNSNLLSIVLGARGTFLICFILLSCYLLYSVLAYTFLIPTGNFLGDIPSVLRGEFWRIITSTVYHYEWEHLLKNMLAIIVLGPFIEWKTGSFALVTSFFLSSWIGVLLFSFGFGGFYSVNLWNRNVHLFILWGINVSVWFISNGYNCFINKETGIFFNDEVCFTWLVSLLLHSWLLA